MSQMPQMDILTETPDISLDAVRAYKRYLRVGFIAIALLVLGVGGWATFFHIKGAVIAPGTVVVESKPKIIQHRDGGIVGAIPVKEGDRVAEGAVVMELDPTQIEANRKIVETRHYETLARVARLQAERDQLDSIAWPAELENLASDPVVQRAMTGQEKLFQARRTAYWGQVNQLRRRVAQLNDQIEGLGSLIGANLRQVTLIRGELVDLREGLNRGVVTRTRYNSVQREQARLEGDIANSQAEIARIQNSIGETDIQILQLRREQQEQVLTELRDAQTESSDYREQLTSASDQRDRIELRAPSAGIVHNLSVTTIGGVIAPGQEIMQIIPDGERLIVEAQVQPQDVDQIYPGQPAIIRFSAFNARTTPEVSGEVLQVSADRLLDPVTGFPYFTIKLVVPPDELKRLGAVSLIPGMPAEAFMQTQSRSVLSYVMKPVTDAMRRAGREE